VDAGFNKDLRDNCGRRGTMAGAKSGDTVKVHYTGKLDDGTVFDSSLERDPLEFTIGEGAVIPGFESAVIGMAEGESKTETITAEDAYGPHNPEMVQEVERSMIPPDIDVKVGQHLQITRPGVAPLVLTVVEISGEIVTLDANHPLAGQDLTFDIELVEIKE
jgi:peptidylprolyl isomerase